MGIDVDLIERVIDIAASPETVFTLLTDPQEYVRWKGRAAQLEPRAGGRFHVSFKDAAVRGEYVEVVPNRRVVFTWGWEGIEGLAPGTSRVEVSLAEDRDGTILRLRHSGLPNESACQLHIYGWGVGLDQLVRVTSYAATCT